MVLYRPYFLLLTFGVRGDQSKQMEFHGAVTLLEEGETFLVGTCRFSVSRLNQNGEPIYADGNMER